jgi:hypothetical protein
LDTNYKPYLIAATVLIDSPMKLHVKNQNHSAVLFGSTDEEQVKNVVRFEAQVRSLELFKILNVANKPWFLELLLTDGLNVRLPLLVFLNVGILVLLLLLFGFEFELVLAVKSLEFLLLLEDATICLLRIDTMPAM